MHGAEELGEVLAPGPAFGQVQGEAAGGAGQAGGHVDQVVTDGGGGRSCVERSGQGASGAGQVVRQGCQGEPGGIGREMAGGRVGEGAVLDIGDHLLDDSVPAVITLGILQGERGVGERGVVAPGIEERALPGEDGADAQALDAAHDQTGGDLLFLRLGRRCTPSRLSRRPRSSTGPLRPRSPWGT